MSGFFVFVIDSALHKWYSLGEQMIKRFIKRFYFWVFDKTFYQKRKGFTYEQSSNY